MFMYMHKKCNIEELLLKDTMTVMTVMTVMYIDCYSNVLMSLVISDNS